MEISWYINDGNKMLIVNSELLPNALVIFVTEDEETIANAKWFHRGNLVNYPLKRVTDFSSFNSNLVEGILLEVMEHASN